MAYHLPEVALPCEKSFRPDRGDMHASTKTLHGNIEERVIQLRSGLAAIPERLLLAHGRGEVLFIAGAGISRPSGLPDFRGLVLKIYSHLDTAVHAAICDDPELKRSKVGLTLTNQQKAEVDRFSKGDYDVVLGMLERRMDGHTHGKSRVRQMIADELRPAGVKPADIHRILMSLSDRGGAIAVVTTNFELLLEHSVKNSVPTYALGEIPRPGRKDDFSGVFHIHGAVARDRTRTTDLIVTDHDFGEFYMRRRIVPDFIYDAARLYHLVLVGYSANDAPMRYLLNAVAADGTRFSDLKERFTFVGSTDPVELEDWKGRGITPIPYDPKDNHAMLATTLKRWADLSAINGDQRIVDAEIKRIVKTGRNAAEDADRDLFDHLLRRSDTNGRIHLAALASKHKADVGWLDAAIRISTEGDGMQL